MGVALLHESVDGEWSSIETLRHLLDEEWQHRLYAERDLAVLAAR